MITLKQLIDVEASLIKAAERKRLENELGVATKQLYLENKTLSPRFNKISKIDQLAVNF